MGSASPGEVRAVAIRDGVVLDYAIERAGMAGAVGDLFRGRVISRLRSLAGAFVALGQAPDGFLPDSAGGAGAGEGDILAVRVVRAAQGGKGPRLAVDGAANPPAGPPALVSRGPGAIERLAARHATVSVVVDDTVLLARLRPLLGERVRLCSGAFGDDVEAAIDGLTEMTAPLPGGGRMTVEPTAALVAIDVDLAGAAVAGAKSAAHRAANVGFIPEITRQIRLRELGGAIVIDFAGLSPRARAPLGQVLEQALADDFARPRFLGFSALGLAEILRPRGQAPLHEVMRGPHAAGLAGLRALARDGQARPVRAPALRVAPDVGRALRDDDVARADIARRFGRPLMLHEDAALPGGAWRLEAS